VKSRAIAPAYLLHGPSPRTTSRSPFRSARAPSFATTGPDDGSKYRASAASRTARVSSSLIPAAGGDVGQTLRWNNIGRAEGREVRTTSGILSRVLDEVATWRRPIRSGSCHGLLEGAMMCYRLARSLSESDCRDRPRGRRDDCRRSPSRSAPSRPPLPRDGDRFVASDGSSGGRTGLLAFKGWRKPSALGRDQRLPPRGRSQCASPRAGRDWSSPGQRTGRPRGLRVVLYRSRGRSHLAPDAGRTPFWQDRARLKANDLIWEFFRKHPMP